MQAAVSLMWMFCSLLIRDGFKFPLDESHQEIPYISPPIS